MAENESSYSLFVEITLAVVATALAFLLWNRKASEDKKDVSMLSEQKTNTDDANLTDTKDDTTRQKENNGIQTNSLMAENADSVQQLGASRCAGLQTESTSTQTDFDYSDRNIASDDLSILWKAVLVNGNDQLSKRYRTELHVDIDGTVSHFQSLQKEGVVGVGMQQIVMKVQ